MASLRAPKNVSPTIKFARWSFLLCGLIYGMNKRAVLEVIDKKESALRQQSLERKRLRQFEEMKRTYKELLVTFGDIFGMEFPPGWEPPV